MSSYLIYSLDTPSTDIAENKRLGYRVPRNVLLPPYLALTPYYTEYSDTIDEVFSTTVDQPTEILAKLRNVWPTVPSTEQIIENHELLNFSDWPQFEREILVHQVNSLGMKLQTAGILSDDQYQIISRWVGQYWFGKGTESFINFINYCLGSSLSVQWLWTQDYVTFLPDGDPGIGTPIWKGGTWYPTSHVSINAAGGLASLDPQTLVAFFYEIANYNLVLQSLNLTFNLWIVDKIAPGYTDAQIVAMGMYEVANITLANFAQFGAPAPTIYNVDPAQSTNIWIPSGAPSTYMLASPTSWIIQGNKKFPVYSPHDQQITNGSDVPTTVMGGASTNGQASGYRLVWGPVTWVQVPGTDPGTSMVPGYSVMPIQSSSTVLPTVMVGSQRQYILTNPAGFADIGNTGYLTPYWNLTD